MLFEGSQQGFVGGFSLAIALGVPGGGVQVSYIQFLAKVSIDPAVKLRPIIGYNVFPAEPSNISVFD